MSHDFVEAALMRRAGYHVWLVADLVGSYEQQPPDLLAELQRDRRWCQGNLQNARLMAEPGLHPVHRAMFVTGTMAYVSAPLWLAFLTLGTALWLTRLERGRALAGDADGTGRPLAVDAVPAVPAARPGHRGRADARRAAPVRRPRRPAQERRARKRAGRSCRRRFACWPTRCSWWWRSPASSSTGSRLRAKPPPCRGASPSASWRR